MDAGTPAPSDAGSHNPQPAEERHSSESKEPAEPPQPAEQDSQSGEALTTAQAVEDQQPPTSGQHVPGDMTVEDASGPESKESVGPSNAEASAESSPPPAAGEVQTTANPAATGQRSVKFAPKAVHFIQHLTALNFATFSNVTWKLLEKKWKEKYSRNSCHKTAEKVLLITCANLLMFQHNYCTGVFVSLVPMIEDEFWDEVLPGNGTNDTLPLYDGAPDVNFGPHEGIGYLQSSGQAISAVIGVATGCLVTAAKGTLKGRILLLDYCVAIFSVFAILAMVLAETYWAYFGAYVIFMISAGVMSSVVLPTQLLVASSEKQLIVQGITVLSKYAGMIVGMAITAYVDSTSESDDTVTVEEIGQCMEFGTDTVEPGLLSFYSCLSPRGQAYLPAVFISLVTVVLFTANPRLWKHMCAFSRSAHVSAKNRFYDSTQKTFVASKTVKALTVRRAKVAPESSPPISDTLVDLETLTEQQQMRLLYNEIFGQDSGQDVKSESSSTVSKPSSQNKSAAYHLHKMCKAMGIESTFAQAEKMAARFDPDNDSNVSFEEFVAGFKRIKSTSSGNDAAVVMATSCSRVWKSADFVVLTLMSTISLLPGHGLLIFSISFQQEFFEGVPIPGTDGGEVTLSIIQYVTAATALGSLLLGIGVVFLVIFQKCINTSTREFYCTKQSESGKPKERKERVMNRGSMLYVTALALLTSGSMIGCLYLVGDVWSFWVLQMILMSLLLTIYTTVRAMMIDTVKPQDFSLALSQSNLISQLFGATPASLIWGAVTDSGWGATGAWLLFGCTPLLILPLSITMAIRLSSKYVDAKAAQDAALRVMAQAVAAQGLNRQKMLKKTFLTYAAHRSVDHTSGKGHTIDHSELVAILYDILNDSLAEAEAVNSDARSIRKMETVAKSLIQDDVAPIIMNRLDADGSGNIDFSEFCTGLDNMIKLIAHPALSSLTLVEDVEENNDSAAFIDEAATPAEQQDQSPHLKQAEVAS